MRLRSLLPALLACALAAAPAEAPPGRIPLRHYGPKEGLASLNPVALAQDAEGFLWVGTQSGLYQYDGVRFRRFGLAEGLPASSIVALQAGEDGSLWVGTALKGLARHRDGRFEAWGPERGLPEAGLRGLAPAPGGGLWVATRRGLYFGARDRSFAPVPGWPGGPAHGVAAAEGGRLAWAVGDGAVHLLSSEGLRRSVPVRGFDPAGPLALVVDRSGTLWVRGPGGLHALAPGAGRFLEAAPALPPARTPALSLEPSGRLAVTSNQGLHLLRGGGSAAPEGFLRAESPYCSFTDREGSLWVGTRSLARALGGGAFEVHTTAEGLPSNLLWGLHRGRDGALWAGTQDGAARGTAKGWIPVEGTGGCNIRSIAETADGALWFGQRQGPLLRLAPGADRAVSPGPGSGFRARGVLGLLADPEGNLWLAQQEGGLARGRRRDGRWTFEPVALPGGGPGESLFGLARDARGRLLVAGERGLAVLEGGRWRRFTAREGLRDTALYQVAALPGDRLVVAYREALGASILRLAGDRLEPERHLDRAAGLAGDHVYMLGLDAAGRLWLGTGNGATRMDGGRLESFTSEDGLAGDDCDAQSFLADPDGAVWIGSNTGLTRLRPREAGPAGPPPRSLIRELLASGNLLQGWTGEGPVVPREHNTLEFRISALSFLGEGTVEHQVRLRGLEPDWQALQGRVARYPALGPGAYTFQVRSRRPGGAWGPEAALPLRILPAWWERTWVRAAAWLLPLVLAAAGARLRFRLLARRNADLQARVEEATATLRSAAGDLERMNQRLTQLNQDKNRMLGVVAHDLRSPLQTVRLHAELLGMGGDGAEDGAREITRITEEMQEMIRRLLDLSHLEAGALDLRPEAVDPLALAERVAAGHRHRAAEKDIRLEVEGGADLPALRADPFYLREALDNLLGNAVKFTPPGPPERRVRVVLGPGTLEVRDEGPGFAEADLPRVFGRFARLSARPTGGEGSTGLGLSIVKALVEAMGGTVDLETGAGRGATFRITLPLAEAD